MCKLIDARMSSSKLNGIEAGQGGIEQEFVHDGIAIFPNKFQACIGTEDVGRLLMIKLVIIVFTFRVKSTTHLNH